MSEKGCAYYDFEAEMDDDDPGEVPVDRDDADGFMTGTCLSEPGEDHIRFDLSATLF